MNYQFKLEILVMRTSIKYFLFLAGLSLLAACNNAPEGEKVQSGAAAETTAEAGEGAVTFAVNTQKSYVNWVGSKLVGSKHNGKVKLQEGELIVADGQLTGGSFTLDMTSIDDESQEGESKAKLERHLKSGDFFEVEKFPTAVFTITGVETANEPNSNITHRITGNLTMKDITKSITIPASITVGQSELSGMTPSFVIDRTEWNVMFNAGVLGTAKDNIINDEIALQVMLIATRNKDIDVMNAEDAKPMTEESVVK